MKIFLDKIETSDKINGLGLKRTIDEKHYASMYFDTELQTYVVIRRPESVGSDAKYSGMILISPSAVACAQVNRDSIPEHQPVGTPATHDTPSGRKKRGSVPAAKKVIAERIKQREALE